ncbi:Thioredoxin M4, chloroplastic, partial [Cucurbita argyrosperma subsp. sororia]
MATVLDSLALPSSSVLASTTFSGRRTSLALPRYRALKVGHSFTSFYKICEIEYQIYSSFWQSRLRRGANIYLLLPSASEATWQSLVIESGVPVLVEFWAPWCGPCRMIHPVVDELSDESIPTVIIFKNGEKKEAIIGAVPKTTLTDSMDKFL